MLYSILIYDSEAAVNSWTKQEEDALGGHHCCPCTGCSASRYGLGRNLSTLCNVGDFTSSPVVTPNRAVAVAKIRGPAAALALIEPLHSRLNGYFHFFGVKGALLMQLGRAEGAEAAFEQAIAAANTPAEASHIRFNSNSQKKFDLGVEKQRPHSFLE